MKENICIIGSLNMEIFVGPIDTLPHWGQQSFVNNLEMEPAGSALRVALPLAKLGIKSFILGCVGNDLYGKEIISKVRKESLSTSGIKVIKDKNTGVCIAIRNEKGERAYISYLGSLSFLSLKELPFTEYLILTGYFTLSCIRKNLKNLFELAKKNKTFILLDTGWDTNGWKEKTKREIFSLLPLVDVFLPNYDEARALTDEVDEIKIAKKLFSYGSSAVIIKLGERGSLTITKEGIFKEKANKVKVIDTTAAGEAFNAGVIYGLLKKWDMQNILKFANTLAGVYISTRKYPKLKEVIESVKE